MHLDLFYYKKWIIRNGEEGKGGVGEQHFVDVVLEAVSWIVVFYLRSKNKAILQNGHSYSDILMCRYIYFI